MNEETPRVNRFTGRTHENIKKQSMPVIISTILMMSNALVDSGWIAALGVNQLAALGYVTPLLFIIIGFGNGIGDGVSTLIARCIGIDDKEAAENAGLHGMFLAVIMGIVLPIILVLLFKPTIYFLGGSGIYDYAYQYAFITFLCSFTYYFLGIGSGILRGSSEGKRSAWALTITSILNMILDPIFIFVFKLGMQGAAIATVISTLVGVLIIYHWLVLEHNDKYLHFHFRDFRPNFTIIKEILKVGIPSCMDKAITQVTGLIAVMLLAFMAGTAAISAFTVGWRILNLFLVPDIGIATATMIVCGVAYGSHNYKDFREALRYSLKISVSISLVLTLILFFFAPYVGIFFSNFNIAPDVLSILISFLHVGALLLICSPLLYITMFIFRGVGKGDYSLLMNAMHQLVFMILGMLFCVYWLKMGEIGIWWGFVIGTLLGSVFNYVIFRRFYVKLIHEWHIAKP